MARPQPDRDADVPVQRLRVQYAKRDRLRFVSHRDFQRALERALRRAAVPVAFSAGFSPHPRISYAGAAPTGAASEAEYFELAVTAWQEPANLRSALDESLPAGLDVVTVVTVEPGQPSLPELLEASLWEITLSQVTAEEAGRAVATFLACDEVEVERRTKKGIRTFDARGAVVSCTVSTRSARTGDDNPLPCAILHAVVRHGTPAVRPDDMLTGIRTVAGLQSPSPAAVTRLRQGPLVSETGEVLDPFAPALGALREE
ncbi:MAG: DUF2344 domain-containing protein [Streptosporangiales bacterium]|nr:DUF2344 domain-containing protein [Streptosporangiales bacterium]